MLIIKVSDHQTQNVPQSHDGPHIVSAIAAALSR